MRVLITREVDQAGARRLREAGLEVDVWRSETPMPRADLLERVRGCAGLVPMPTEQVDGEVLDAGPLRVVATHSVGYDHVDLDAARQRGVVVAHTPEVLTDATADLTMALLLATARHVVAGDRLVRRGGFHGWRPTMMRGMELAGRRLGLIGRGRIGTAVEARARAFGMEVVHHARSSGLPLDELLATSHVVSVHCPLNEATHHLVGAEALRAMRSDALLINTSRGAVVDEAALARALREEEIAGAGLDVYEEEPAVHPELPELSNVTLLPHLGSATFDARRRMAETAARNAVAVLRGEPPPNPVVTPG